MVGCLGIDAGCALYVGPAFETSRHAHHAIQVCVGLDGPVRMRGGPGTRWQAHHGAIIAADRLHELSADGRAVALLYVDPESPDGRRLRAGAGIGVTPLAPARVAALRAAVRAAGETVDLVDLRELLGPGSVSVAPVDPRVARAIRALRDRMAGRPSSAELARHVGLSVGRFRHLFLHEVGLSYRRYLLWLRLRTALEGLRRDGSLTAAAHAAGFADSAHLTRTARRMFGIAPSAMPRVG